MLLHVKDKVTSLALSFIALYRHIYFGKCYETIKIYRKLRQNEGTNKQLVESLTKGMLK